MMQNKTWNIDMIEKIITELIFKAEKTNVPIGNKIKDNRDTMLKTLPKNSSEISDWIFENIWTSNIIINNELSPKRKIIKYIFLIRKIGNKMTEDIIKKLQHLDIVKSLLKNLFIYAPIIFPIFWLTNT